MSCEFLFQSWCNRLRIKAFWFSAVTNLQLFIFTLGFYGVHKSPEASELNTVRTGVQAEMFFKIYATSASIVVRDN